MYMHFTYTAIHIRTPNKCARYKLLVSIKPTPRVFGFLFSLCLTEVFGLLPAPSVRGDLVSCHFLASYDHVIGAIYKVIKLRFPVLCNIGSSLALKGSDDITGILFWALTLHIFPLLLCFCANSISATNIQVGSMRMSMKFELALLVTPPPKTGSTDSLTPNN